MVPWEDGLYLFTQEEYDRLPIGTVLTCISGAEVTKGIDVVDADTRFGYLAYGVKDPWDHPLKHLFLMFKLSH